MKKILMILSVFGLLTVTAVHAQGYQQVYNRLNQVCHIHLGRGDLPELAGWAHQIVTKQVPMETIVIGIINSEEARARREAATGSSETTTDESATDSSTTDSSADTTSTDGSTSDVPPSPAYINIVQQLKYQSLVYLGRTNVDEIPMWADQILRGNMKLEAVIIGIQNSDEAKARAGTLSSSDSTADPVEGLGQ